MRGGNRLSCLGSAHNENQGDHYCEYQCKNPKELHEGDHHSLLTDHT